ncbi:MAG: acyltransferase family protein [Alphaproteobacteria bacterium]|nr:acyltransferase family protein [Alphaproteobacteria bacterium]
MKPTFTDGRLPGLDGLRAIAVTAVFLFHADITWTKGGYLGVDLFFVISGFLITSLLMAETEKLGRLRIGDFYVRRARRLLPASYLMTVTVILAAKIWAPDALPRLRDDTIASLFYVTNWEFIFRGQSYFTDIARQPLLTHLWSLAIEEQFYIVWAPVLYFLAPKHSRRALAIGAALLAAASVAWMAISAKRLGLPDSGADASRLYFGTDTHGFGLIVGAVLGLLWQPNHQPKAINPATKDGVFILGLLPLAGTVALMVTMSESVSWLYPWGFLLSALTSAALIMAATYRSAAFGAVLDNGVMRWLGERSYGVYLWHWPIFMMTRPDIDLHWPHDQIFGFRLVLTLGISALSYRYVEQPIRHGALGRVWERLMSDRRWIGLFAWRAAAVAASAATMVIAAASVLVMAPKQALPAKDVLIAMGLDPNTGLPSTSNAIIAPVKPVLPAVRPPTVPVDEYLGQDVTAVGDSVLLGASAVLTKMLPGIHIYATVGWQAANVLNQLQALADAKALTPVVLIHLGTNGIVTEDQLRKMLSLLSDRKRVILVNTHVPRRWQDDNNDTIQRVARDYPNVVLADWHDVAEGQPDFFVSDGVHLTVPGMHVFAAEIMRAGHLVSPPPKGGDKKIAKADAIDPDLPFAYPPGDSSKTLVRVAQPQAPASYWQRLAKCESNGNWTHGGQHAGGLNIFVPSWRAWGGAEFAPTPDKATPEQQITVANRIATDGWARPNGTVQMPIGFAGWGCLSKVGRPPASGEYTFTPESVLKQQFHIGERGDVVRDLELLLGIQRDGIYGRHTRKLHLALLKNKGLPPELAAAE